MKRAPAEAPKPTGSKSLSDRTAELAAKIDQTCDMLAKEAETPDELRAIEENRTHLHKILAARALEETLDGYTPR